MSRPGFALSILLGTIAASMLVVRDANSDAADFPSKRLRSSKVPTRTERREDTKTALEASYLPYLDIRPLEPTAVQSSATVEVCRSPATNDEIRSSCAEHYDCWDYDVESRQAEDAENPGEFVFGTEDEIQNELCVIDSSTPLVDPIGMTERWFDELRASFEEGVSNGWKIWNATEAARQNARVQADRVAQEVAQIMPWDNLDQAWCEFVAANAEQQQLTPIFFESQQEVGGIDAPEMAREFVEDAASTIESVGQALVRFANMIRSKVST